MSHRLELIVRTGGEGRTELRSPGVGTFTGALATGEILSPGALAGRILTLGVSTELRVPAGTTGRIVSGRPARAHEPVGFGTVLYEIAPLSAETVLSSATTAAAEEALADGLFVRAPLGGRFWHRAAPGEAPLAEVGTTLASGQPVGLIEVMKTFSHVRYEAGAGLPERARVVRLVALDGAEVAEGAPLVEVTAV